MKQAIKILPNSEIVLLSDWQNDNDYINNITCGYSLSLPQFWENKKYKLSIFILDEFKDKDQFNYLATILYNKLKSQYGENEDKVFGFMIICNEDEDKNIDFTIDDINYIISNLDNIKYNSKIYTFDWSNYIQ